MTPPPPSHFIFWCWRQQRKPTGDWAKYFCGQHWGDQVLLHVDISSSQQGKHVISTMVSVRRWQRVTQRVLRVYGGSLSWEVKFSSHIIREGVWGAWRSLKVFSLTETFFLFFYGYLRDCWDWSSPQSVVVCGRREMIGGRWRGSSAPRRPESARAGARPGRRAENWRAAAAPGSAEEGNKEAESLKTRLILMEFEIWSWRKDWPLSGPGNVKWIIIIIIYLCTIVSTTRIVIPLSQLIT